MIDYDRHCSKRSCLPASYGVFQGTNGMAFANLHRWAGSSGREHLEARVRFTMSGTLL